MNTNCNLARRRFPPSRVVPAVLAALIGVATGCTATGNSSSDDAAAGPDTRCYRSVVDGGVLLFDTAGTQATARTIIRGEAEDQFLVAEGRQLEDLSWLMYEKNLGEDETVPAVWSPDGGVFFKSADAAYEVVDCDEVADDVAALEAEVGADPIEVEAVEATPQLAAGRYCFADVDDRHTADDFVELTVGDDVAVTARISNPIGDGSGQLDEAEATGRFVAADVVVMDVVRSDGSETSSERAVWRLGADSSTLAFQRLGFTNDAVDCE